MAENTNWPPAGKTRRAAENILNFKAASRSAGNARGTGRGTTAGCRGRPGSGRKRMPGCPRRPLRQTASATQAQQAISAGARGLASCAAASAPAPPVTITISAAGGLVRRGQRLRRDRARQRPGGQQQQEAQRPAAQHQRAARFGGYVSFFLHQAHLAWFRAPAAVR